MYTSDLTEAQKAFIKETIPMDNWTSKHDFFLFFVLTRHGATDIVNGRRSYGIQNGMTFSYSGNRLIRCPAVCRQSSTQSVAAVSK